MGSKFDPDKDAANIAKHGLSLVEGEGVLNDPLGLTIEDDSSQGASLDHGRCERCRRAAGCGVDGARRWRAPDLRSKSQREGAESI